MCTRLERWIILLSFCIIILSVSSFWFNFFIYQYPGNNYFPDNTLHIALSLILFYTGFLLLLGKNSRFTQSSIELIYFFAVMSIIALATNAVQLTPFPTIDAQIIKFEAKAHINMLQVVAWTYSHPNWYMVLAIIYDSLTYQMCFIPLFILAMGKFTLLRDYYFLLLFTVLFGFIFYYFFPTTAPASMLSSPYFSSYQIATGLKFRQIHQHLSPSTIEGGLIALPSFHTIWALFCVYLLKDWFVAWFILLVINLLLIASCVLIGWHYPIDIVAGLLLAAVSFYLLIKINSRSTHYLCGI